MRLVRVWTTWLPRSKQAQLPRQQAHPRDVSGTAQHSMATPSTVSSRPCSTLTAQSKRNTASGSIWDLDPTASPSPKSSPTHGRKSEGTVEDLDDEEEKKGDLEALVHQEPKRVVIHAKGIIRCSCLVRCMTHTTVAHHSDQLAAQPARRARKKKGGLLTTKSTR